VNREQALSLVRERVQSDNLIKHMLAAEAIMGALAERLGGDQDQWRLAGLLHDLDVEQTADQMEVHGARTVEWLCESGLEDEATLQAILAHNPANGSSIGCVLDRALFACDCLTGLITAAALVRPEKRLELVTLASLQKRFKEPSFAKGARREDIMTCSELGMELDEFLDLGLKAMQEVSDELGL
jgi:putative nucleotidyltransferase with HDIG domain